MTRDEAMLHVGKLYLNNKGELLLCEKEFCTMHLKDDIFKDAMVMLSIKKTIFGWVKGSTYLCDKFTGEVLASFLKPSWLNKLNIKMEF